MGVRGVQTYICNKENVPNGYLPVNILEEINKWKKCSTNGPPILVFDIMSLIVIIARGELQKDIFCGGRHHQYFEMFDHLFKTLKSNGAELVFFSDLNVQNNKVDVWLRRRNEEYKKTMEIFDHVNNGVPLDRIFACQDPNDLKSIMTAMGSLNSVARKYGRFYFSTDRECDQELAQFARDNNALAVISNDTDFLIFEGNWRYWSAKDINLTDFSTFEYSRNALREKLCLSSEQLPLWATLVSNDYMSKYYELLLNFHRSLGNNRLKFDNIAQFVRQFHLLPGNMPRSTIEQIAKRVFGNSRCSADICESMIKSIESYNLEFTRCEITDPLLKQIVHHAGIYNKIVSNVHTLTQQYYDMRCRDITKTYTDVMATLLNKTLGILWKNRNDPKLEYTLLAKWGHQDVWRSTKAKPTYPPFDVPPLLELILEEDSNQNSSLNIIRWKLLSWMLSLSEKDVQRIKCLPNEFLVMTVALLFLVKEEQVTPDEADTILITEMKVRKQETDVKRPYKLQSRVIRVAHLYQKFFVSIHHVLILSGFNKLADSYLKFDGVLFHNLSESFIKDVTSKKNYITHVEDFRLYAKN